MSSDNDKKKCPKCGSTTFNRSQDYSTIHEVVGYFDGDGDWEETDDRGDDYGDWGEFGDSITCDDCGEEFDDVDDLLDPSARVFTDEDGNKFVCVPLDEED